MFGNWLGTMSVILVASMFLACVKGGNEPADLIQASRVIRDMMKPANLSRSGFASRGPEATPSQFVSYIFSEMGAAEWPEHEGMVNPDELKELRAMGMTFMPTGVAFVSGSPDPDEGRQLVIKWNNSERFVIVEGYTNLEEAPVLVRKWKLPKVSR